MRIPMNEEIRTEWVEALRSGEYPQVQGALRKGNGYCCLGVLCEIAVRHGVIPPATMVLTKYVYAHSTSTLPYEVQKWAGLPHQEGYKWPYDIEVGDGNANSLAGLNDTGTTFNEIAELLEQES